MKTNTKYQFYTVALLIVMASGTLFFAVYSQGGFSLGRDRDGRMMNLPLISTRIESEGGESHFVETYITLEVEDDNTDYNVAAIKRMVEEAVSNLEFEKVTVAGNIAYIQQEIKAKLSEELPEENVLGIYVSEFQVGDYHVAAPPYNDSEEGGTGNADRAGRVFNGVN